MSRGHCRAPRRRPEVGSGALDEPRDPYGKARCSWWRQAGPRIHQVDQIRTSTMARTGHTARICSPPARLPRMRRSTDASGSTSKFVATPAAVPVRSAANDLPSVGAVGRLLAPSTHSLDPTPRRRAPASRWEEVIQLQSWENSNVELSGVSDLTKGCAHPAGVGARFGGARLHASLRLTQ